MGDPFEDAQVVIGRDVLPCRFARENQFAINSTFNGPITQFSFDWSNNDTGLGAQAIGLGPLTYDVIPEYDPAFGTAAACLTAILGEKLRRRRSEPKWVRWDRESQKRIAS